MDEELNSNVDDDLIDGGEADDTPDLDENGKPKDKGKWVRRSSLLAVATKVTDLSTKNAALEAKVAELAAQAVAGKPAPVKTEPTKRYTRTELNAMVAAGNVTQEQADQHIDWQVKQDAVAAALAATAGQSRQEKVAADIERYKRAEPDVMKAGSDVRDRIAEEFNYLVNEMGEPGGKEDPNTLRTQLKAMRAVLGPIEKVELAKSGKNGAETDRQSGGNESGGQERKGKTGWDNLDQDRKDWYTKQIRAGVYKDRAAVEAELKYASPRRRAPAR